MAGIVEVGRERWMEFGFEEEIGVCLVCLFRTRPGSTTWTKDTPAKVVVERKKSSKKVFAFYIVKVFQPKTNAKHL